MLGLDYIINYRAGHENKTADALSRFTLPQLEGEIQAISTIVPLWQQEVQRSYENDSLVKTIIENLLVDANAKPNYNY